MSGERKESLTALFHPNEPQPEADDFAQRVRLILDDLGDLLIRKNQAYGDSALNPVRVFSRASASEQLRVRIDDKLSRIQRGTEFEDEDTVIDLMGYLVLYQLSRED